MENPCDDLNQILDQMPVYQSWSVSELEDIFIRFRTVVRKMVESPDYQKCRWLADYCPDFERRIHDMVLEKDFDKQSRYFNNIVYELQYAIEVLMGSLDCNGHEEWVSLLSRILPKAKS